MDDKIIQEVGSRIQKIRKDKGYKQSEFSALFSVSQSSFCDMENGKMKPRFEFVYEMSRQLDVNIHWLFYGEGNPYLNKDDAFMLPDELIKQHHQFLKDFSKYFEGSPIFRYGVMYLILKFLRENDSSIEKDMETHKQDLTGAG